LFKNECALVFSLSLSPSLSFVSPLSHKENKTKHKEQKKTNHNAPSQFKKKRRKRREEENLSLSPARSRSHFFLFSPKQVKNALLLFFLSVLQRDVDADLRGLVHVGGVELRAEGQARKGRKLLLVQDRGEPRALGADLGERARGEPFAVADLLELLERLRKRMRKRVSFLSLKLSLSLVGGRKKKRMKKKKKNSLTAKTVSAPPSRARVTSAPATVAASTLCAYPSFTVLPRSSSIAEAWKSGRVSDAPADQAETEPLAES
jgi:hypothetical protein